MRVRLRTKTTGKTPRVDREAGVIRGLSIIAKGPALGYGFDIDETTLEQVAQLAEGAAGRWTHGNLCADGLGTHLGRWRGVKLAGDHVAGDFHFSPSAKHVRPEGLNVDAQTYLMDLAEHEPDAAGVSAVLDLELEEVEDEATGETRRLARVHKVPRADFVADPAANPDGLFKGTPSELAERATAALTAAAEIHGRDRVASFLRAWLAEAAPAFLSPEAPAVTTIEELKKRHAEELAARDTKIAALEAGLKAAEEREAARRAAEIDSRIAKLKADAAPNAIAEEDVAHVRKLLERGEDELADRLGRLLLSNARAGVTVTGVEVPLGAAPDADHEVAKRGRAALFSAAGIEE